MKKQRIFILCLSMVLIAGLLAPTALAKSSSWVPEITGEGTKTESSWSDQGTEMLPGEDQKPSDFLQTVDGPVIETQPVDAHYDVPNSTKIFVEVAQEDEGKCDFQWQWENNGKWFNFIGADAKKASLDIPATTRTLNETNVRCVITYSKQADKITISDSAQFIMDSEQDTYAIVGHQGLTTGNTIKLTDGGSASLSADGKKLTLKDATINLQEHLMLPSGSTGLQYYVTPEKENDVASIEYSGNNTIYMDNEHSSPDLDGIKKGFANIAFTQMVSDFSNKRMTLNIGGTGTLNLETDAIQKGLFQFYGIYAEAFINIQDYSNINIINPSVGIRTADLTIGKGAEMNIFSENQSILINPSYNAPGDLTINPEASLTAQSMIGNTVSLSGGGGKLKAEKAALNLTTKVDSNYKPYNPEEPIGFITMSTNRPEDAEEDQGSISLMNCDTNIKVFTDLQNVVFQQGIRAAGTLTVDGGTLKMNSDDGKPEYSGGSFGVQGNDVILKNNAKADIQLNGNNLVFGLIADNKLDISNASANVVIDNSEGRFDLKEEKAEVLGIGAMTMDIGVADSTNKVSSKIINYDNSLAIGAYSGGSREAKNYDPTYIPSKINLSDKAVFLIPQAPEATLNQASLETRQVQGDPKYEYTVFETAYHKANTKQGVKEAAIGVPSTIEPAAITKNPTSVSVKAGEKASFAIENTGSLPIVYKWEVSTDNGKTWTMIENAMGREYTTEAATMQMNGYQYRATVSNEGASVTSKTAVLTVTDMPAPTPTPNPTPGPKTGMGQSVENSAVTEVISLIAIGVLTLGCYQYSKKRTH